MNFTKEQYENYILPRLLEWFGLESNPKYLTDVLEELEDLVIKNMQDVSLAVHLFVRTLKSNVLQELELLKKEAY